MTKQEILQSVRNIVNEMSADAGALLDDAGNLLDFVNDAIEHVVLDLIPWMPSQFLSTTTVTTVSGTQEYSIGAPVEYWQIYKVEYNVTGSSPKEIEIVDPLDQQFYTTVGETSEYPLRCYFMGDKMYLVPIPSSAVTSYIKIYYIKPEATTLATTGPVYIPRPAHRLIVYRAAYLAAMMADADPSKYILLYEQRKDAINRVWVNRFQQKPKFVREGVDDRTIMDARDKAFYDKDWR